MEASSSKPENSKDQSCLAVDEHSEVDSENSGDSSSSASSPLPVDNL